MYKPTRVMNQITQQKKEEQKREQKKEEQINKTLKKDYSLNKTFFDPANSSPPNNFMINFIHCNSIS